jgi:hypothetical protein
MLCGPIKLYQEWLRPSSAQKKKLYQKYKQQFLNLEDLTPTIARIKMTFKTFLRGFC